MLVLLSLVIAASAASSANLMGLGGYHLVTEIAHSISRDGFNTAIKARWVSSGKRGDDEVAATPEADSD